MQRRDILLGVTTFTGLAIAIVGSVSALDTARTVDIISTFAGAFGAGAAVTAWWSGRRAAGGQGGRDRRG